MMTGCVSSSRSLEKNQGSRLDGLVPAFSTEPLYS